MPTTRELLIRAATALLDEGGRDHVTLREVGRRAGVSHNAPYKHFADKEALLAAVAAQDLDETARIIDDVGGTAGLEAAIHAAIAHAMEHPERFRLVYGPWTHEPAALVVAADATWRAMLNAVVGEQAAGLLPAGDPALLAGLIRVVAHGAVDLALSGHLTESKAEHGTPGSIVSAQLDLLATAARARPPG